MERYSDDKIELLYSKARTAYFNCISNEENSYLADEIDIPIRAIQIKEAFI